MAKFVVSGSVQEVRSKVDSLVSGTNEDKVWAANMLADFKWENIPLMAKQEAKAALRNTLYSSKSAKVKVACFRALEKVASNELTPSVKVVYLGALKRVCASGATADMSFKTVVDYYNEIKEYESDDNPAVVSMARTNSKFVKEIIDSMRNRMDA